MRRLCKRHVVPLLAVAITMLVALGSFGAAVDLQGVNKGSTNYFGGPLNGWNELEFIPCRVVLNNPGSNQVVVFFNNNANGKPGIQNLLYFTPSSNVVMSTPVLTAASSLQDWYYTINVNVTDSQVGYIYYQARMAAGAHLFGGASLHMYNPQLQLAKPVPASGTPDLVITKTGPAAVTPGQTVTYSVTFSNKFTALNAAVGVEIYDTLPTGMTYANIWSGSPGVQFFQALGNEVWWEVPDLQPGDSGTLSYQVTIATNIPNGTVLQNNAQILCTQNDANMADNVSIATSTISAALPPNVAPDSYSVNQNQTLTVSAPGVLANDSDPGNLTLKAFLATNVTSGTLTLNTNGSFTYVPAPNVSGTFYFYYVAGNGTNSSQPAKVTINVFHFAAPADASLSCAASVPTAATNLTQYLAQGGIDGGPYCGQPTALTFMGDASNGGAGCPASPLVVTRTYKLTTGCGDVTNVVQKFTVIDTTSPVISAFPADATYSCAGQLPAPNDSLVTASDNCSAITVTHNTDIVTSSNCVNRLTISRAYVVSDACGNSTSRTQTITVNGTTSPIITTFPSDATYSCVGSVPLANDTLVAATNACGGSSGITISHSADSISASNCVNRFTIKRTYTATDTCGNSSSQTQRITVNATTPPTITGFPADATFSCAAAVPPANDTLVTAANACGGSAGLVIAHAADVVTSSNCVNRLTLSRTYVATDACGNSSSKTQTITVNGTTPPAIVAFPSDVTVFCASAVPTPDNSLVTVTDNCGGSATVTISHDADVVTSSNCVNRFVITRTYRATDSCGNVTSRNQAITVNQTTAPTIVAFPPDATFSCASAVLAPDDSQVTATDGCGSSAVAIRHIADVITSSNCPSRIAIGRTYVATDVCGNSSSRTQRIVVNGTVVPSITTFPADATYSCASAVPSADDSVVVAIDNCGTSVPVSISHDADIVSASNCVGRFSITRTYHATDACNNIATKSQTITVNSTTVPTITGFPADATYSCASAVPAADDALVAATDACGGSSGVVVSHRADIVAPGSCANRYSLTRTYVATDACGNSSSKSQTITVNSTTAPTITVFPADATYACAGAVPAPDNSLVTATDGCGGTSGIVISHNADSVTASNCVNRLTITRTYTATDACGNSSSKNQTITVNGTVAPTITAFPADATVSCAGAVPAADNTVVAATNACGGNLGVVISHNADVITYSNCVNRFKVTRTYVATDACGNSSSQNQTITVNATNSPTITAFPVDTTVSCASAVPGADDTLVTATDNCGGGSVTISHDADVIASGACANRFSITRTYRATDACGNSSSKSQTITVNSSTAPTITGFPADVTYSCASSVPAANDSLVTATDSCGGSSGVVISHSADVVAAGACANRFTITRTYVATDACGNSSSKSQTITVNSTTAPT
ncbi:MAG: HYR-like domain-containing protein, partial [Limisphaerales bacterium]